MFFSLEIETCAAQGHFVPCETLSAQYRGLVDGSTYRVVLVNHLDVEADAVLEIDGRVQGTYRLNPRETFPVERPANTQRSFVFVKENGTLAREAGVVSGESENGLVKVEFKPRKKTQWDMPFTNECAGYPRNATLSNNMGSRSLGLTAKGGYIGHTAQNNISFDSSAQPMVYKVGGTPGHSIVSTKSPASVIGGGATALGENTTQKFFTVSDIEEKDIDKAKVTVLIVRLLAVDKPKLQALRSVPNPLIQNVPPPFLASPFLPQ